jgi:predicted DNA-binding ribbon-helix-helix protein
MSRQLLNNYYNKLDQTIRFGGSRSKTTVERAFIQLVNSYAERRNLTLVPKVLKIALENAFFCVGIRG